ncbi:MAG: UDP-N-acetylmuramate dehydrogenase [Gammaproteobacteria bacterium]
MLVETNEIRDSSNRSGILDLDITKTMKKSESQEIKLRGVMKLDEPMKKHTSWRTGGHAERYFKPADVDDLCCFLKQVTKDEPIFWLGLGSNLLVRDGGLKGTVIALSGVLNDLKVYDGISMHIGAGVACAKVVRMSAQCGLTGGEFLAGIPGTMGGALAMNAGCFGSETWNIVRSVETINRQGQRIKRDASDFEAGYRHVNLPEDEWFISAELLLAKDEDGKGMERIQTLLNQRAESQPTGKASCGSVFRNPDSVYAARLIEDSGLKGISVGDACVSEKHANFIINSGNATAGDIESLILIIQEKVKQDHGIELIPEVRIVGEQK